MIRQQKTIKHFFVTGFLNNVVKVKRFVSQKYGYFQLSNLLNISYGLLDRQNRNWISVMESVMKNSSTFSFTKHD